MSDPENFLTRWSRRKRELDEHEAAQSPDQTPLPEASAAAGPSAGGPAGSGVVAEPKDDSQTFDPASLPPLESITAETDIRGYFARGVPAELARAALRRVWASDPAIRDFVGLAENAWDFNAPHTIPGFGPITAADDVAGMMRQMLGEAQEMVRQADELPNPIDSVQAPEIPNYLPGGEQAEIVSRDETALPRDVQQGGAIMDPQTTSPRPMRDTTPSQTAELREQPVRGHGEQPVRGHGGALPK